MRRVLLVVLLNIVLAPLAWAQDCKWCDMSMDKKVMWGKYAFCSEDCRQEWYEDRRRCKICNDRVDPKSTGGARYVGGGITIVQITPNRWDGYCDFCRKGVKDGLIDPVKDRYVAPDYDNDFGVEFAEPAPAQETQPAGDLDPDDDDDEPRSYLKWLIGGAVGLVFLLAKALR